MRQLLAFYDYPAEDWVHLRTTNPIESTFATVRHRTKVTKGPGSRAAELAMAVKLIESAQDHWRMVNAPHLVALIRSAGYQGSRPTFYRRLRRHGLLSLGCQQCAKPQGPSGIPRTPAHELRRTPQLPIRVPLI